MKDVKKCILCTALGTLLGVSNAASHASTLNAGDTLTITPGVTNFVTTYNQPVVTGGSYFAIDDRGDSTILITDKEPLAQGTAGLVIGATTSPRAIDQWKFLNIPGSDSLAFAASGGTSSGSSAGGLNLSGWTMNWNSQVVSLGGGAWQPVNCSALDCTGHIFTNGNADFAWDGVYGDAYTLNYTATLPANSFVPNAQYYLHLEGFVRPVPLPATGWLFISGLVGVFSFGTYRRQTRGELLGS